MSQLFRINLLLVGPASSRPPDLLTALFQAGFRVEELAEGADLEQAVADRQTDAVLLIVGDGGDAKSAVGAIQSAAHGADLPLIALSTAGTPDHLADLLVAGADDALGTPLRMPELRARIDRLLQARQDLREMRAMLRSRDLMFDIFQEVSASLRAEEILQTLVRRVGEALGLAHCSFVLAAPGEREGRVVAIFENPSLRDLRIDLEHYPELQEALRTERPVVIENIKEHPLFTRIRQRWAAQSLDIKVKSAVALPVFVQGAPGGIFFLRTREGDAELRPRDVELANTIAQAAARVLENEERRAAIFRRQSSAAIDTLTGCASLDGLDRRLRDEFERARRYRLRFCLVLLDLDHFRDTNERLGKEAGDAVLGDLGRLLQREMRAPDFVARYGGDEFALLLPETDARGARNFIQRLRGLIAKHPFPAVAGSRPTFSAGIVTFPHPEALRPEDLLRLVDGAVRKAKTSADDRIAIAVSSAA